MADEKQQIQVSVSLEKWAEDLVARTIAQHVAACPLAPRLSLVELRFASFVGYMIGSGVGGGVAGGFLVTLLGG